MDFCRAVWALVFVLIVAQASGSGCIVKSDDPDSGNLDACNEAVECDYEIVLDPAPMGYHAFFFDYVCSGDTLDNKLDPGILPDSGCFIILVGEWIDVFANIGCEKHCIEPGWICHYVDVESDTAWVESWYPPEESPIVGSVPEVVNPTILEVPCQGKVYRFDQSNEEWTWEEPPSEFAKVLRLVSCDGCEGGSRDIVLPLE